MAAAADLPLGSSLGAGAAAAVEPCGAISDPIPPPPEPSSDQEVGVVADGESDGNACSAAPPSKEKKAAWNMSSSAGEAAAAAPVMDTFSWPALSDSARASPKSSSSESLRSLPESCASAPPAPVVASSPARAAISDNLNLNNAPNPAPPSPLKASSKQRGFSNGGREPSTKESPNKNHNQSRDYGTNELGFSQYSHGDHLGHGGNRRGSDGWSYQGRPGGRREHERGGYEWNHWRGFGPRDAVMQPMPPPQRGLPRPHLRQAPPPPIPTMPFVPPPLVLPYANHMVIAEVPSPVFIHPPPFPEAIRNMPMFPPVGPPTLFYPQVDLRAMLLKQIEYYFSTDNLCKDTYLRQQMDDQGWVNLSLIAGFKKVKLLTNDVRYILDTISSSNVVEVQPGAGPAGIQIQNYRVRRRGDWRNWVLPANNNNNNTVAHHQHGIAASARPPVRDVDLLPTSFRALDLGEGGSSSASAAVN